jgi:hypothetical protein
LKNIFPAGYSDIVSQVLPWFYFVTQPFGKFGKTLINFPNTFGLRSCVLHVMLLFVIFLALLGPGFLLVAATTWIQLGSDLDGEAAGDLFGISIALSCDGLILAVGGHSGGTDAGHARVYQYSNNAWAQLGSDLDGEAAGDLFGYAIALSCEGLTLAVGGYNNDGGGSNAGHARGHSLV